MVRIIGAGLAGSILKRLLDQNKIRSEIYDAMMPWRASIISENLFSMTWSKTLGPAVLNNGIKTLERLVDIKSINFKTLAGYNSTLYVPVDDILVQFKNKGVLPEDFKGSDVVVDCRGYWAQIHDQNKMIGLTGQGLFIDGKIPIEPTMNFVAPYTHQKAFQVDKKRHWYGDSTCVDLNKYVPRQSEYEGRCEDRARKLLGSLGRYYIVHGIRPFVKGYKGYLKFDGNRIVNTGGWKCGLVIYSDHAQRILKYIQSL